MRGLTLLLEGCTSENEYNVPWPDPSHNVVKLIKTLTNYLRHLPLVAYDSEGFVRISELMKARNNLQTVAKLLNAVITNP